MEPPSKKYKAINEFFKPVSKCPSAGQNLLEPKSTGEEETKQTFTIKSTPVPGLNILLDFIKPAEE